MALTRSPLKRKTAKQKRCKSAECKTLFIPTRPMQNVCDWKCAAVYVAALAAKKDRQSNAKAKRDFYLKDRRTQVGLAQVNFNKYIRLRDHAEPCISCNRHHTGQYHAGHYLTVGGHPELRFNNDNCHKQCSVCNNHLSGNIAAYRINLIKKIGIDRVEKLEGPQEKTKLTVDEIIEVKKSYSAMCREIEREM